jgi:predicted transcriptional regulator
MPFSDPPMPTDAELAILRVLWAHGPCTVRAVQDHLDRDEPIGYTTVLKLLQIMLEKGLVTRDESQRAHIYAAAVSEPSTQQRLVDDLLERAFGGSARRLVMQALDSDRVSDDELDDIRALLDQLDAQTDDDSDASTA